MTESPLRSAYRLILRCHPAAFYERFGEEMLWIFDEERKLGNGGHVIIDGTVSLLRQHCKARCAPEPSPMDYEILMGGSGVGVARVMQAFVLFSMIVGGLLVFGGAGHLLPLAIRPSDSSFRCTISLDPPHVATLPSTLKLLR